jgi:6,7-dimethyl-8-ribityllumazine synthase
MNLTLNSPIPIIFGILTVNTIAQGEDRVSDKKLNKGEEFALSALEMISLNKKI